MVQGVFWRDTSDTYKGGKVGLREGRIELTRKSFSFLWSHEAFFLT